MDDRGAVRSLIGTFVDVTEMRRTEDERRRLETSMQQTQKLESLGVLAGGIAHDFNNVLTGVLGNASLALTKLESGSPVRVLIERIERSAQRAAELTSQMLAYAGKGRFRIEQTDLARLVGEMAPLLHSSVSKKAVLDLRLEPATAVVDADTQQMRQVVMNLVTNASDALRDGNGTIRVTTGALEADAAFLARAWFEHGLRPGTYAVLTVEDTGCGMDAATLDRIFEPFFTTKAAGRGLGLAATVGIVRGHGGTLFVESRPDAGSRIQVLLPRSSKGVAQSVVVPDRLAEDPGALVLVVDDEESVVAVSQMVLEDAGSRVLTAVDGVEGVDHVRRHGAGIALVLLDMTMPRKNGVEAYREMREIAPEIRIVLCSGYTEQEATETFSDHGLSGFLQKPFRAGDLLQKVREVLAS
jgi:signal transduction histidine kinase/CheY-like chemotaxis protein